ncbi:MAG: type 1 glutamine amidotransferase [Phycisphaerae bacterium]
MNIHYLQHVAFEGPSAIAQWALARGHRITGTHLYRGEALPQVAEFDLLVIMGGPMSVLEESEYAWLRAEKQLVRDVIAAQRSVLGICLGAQMIANALGARVYPGPEKEIGWFPVRRVSTAGMGALLPEVFTPLHWHGETFDLPAQAVRLAETDPVPNQAFALGNRLLGLQFHLEATPESVRELVAADGASIRPGGYQQPAEVILECEKSCQAVHPVLHRLLDYLCARP